MPTSHDALAQAKKSGGNSQIQQLQERVAQLEEQLVDMRVVIGTLQSLAKAPGRGVSVPAGGFQGGGGGANGGRLTILETQIRALTAQVERLDARLKGSGGSGRGGGETDGRRRSGGQGGFGSTVVSPSKPKNGGDRIGNFITRQNTPATNERSGGWGEQGGAAQTKFDAAYNAWLQGAIGKAQQGFRTFISANAGHPLAGEAYYWLGETYYQQQRFNQAAKSFLKVTQSFRSSRLASDSLYKLALSLDKLGHTKSACSALSELRREYPQAPRGVLRQAAAKQRRLGC